jgi:hypothetical protein
VNFLFIIIFPLMAVASVKTDAFVITINDRSIAVLSPATSRPLFSVIVENRSLSNQIGKFTVNDKIIKFISVLSGQSETIEIENKSKSSVVFVPVGPAFQDVELKFGKRAYEIPSKE